MYPLFLKYDKIFFKNDTDSVEIEKLQFIIEIESLIKNISQYFILCTNLHLIFPLGKIFLGDKYFVKGVKWSGCFDVGSREARERENLYSEADFPASAFLASF